MDENVYMLPDGGICLRIGERLKNLRLRQNLTQKELADQAQISVSSIKKIENGEIGTFDSLMRVLRILGELDVLTPLMREVTMSPNEYLKFVETLKKKQRRRVTSSSRKDLQFLSSNKTESEW